MRFYKIDKNNISDFFQNYLVSSICIFIAYFILAKSGLKLATINETASPVWPASGIANGFLFLYGIRFWPSILFSAFLVNALNNTPLVAVSFISIGNTLEAIIGASILFFFTQKKYLASSHTRTLAITFSSLIGAAVSAMIGTLALILSGASPGSMFDTIWITWWTGDVLGAMIILPLLFSFTKNIFNEFSNKQEKSNPLLIAIILSIGCFLCWLLFINHEGAPYLFFIFPYLLWCVSKTGERGGAVGALLISLAGILSIQFGYGVFVHGTTNANLINLQLFLASVAVSSLMMVDLQRMSSLKQPALILFFSWLFAGILFIGFYYKSTNDASERLKVIVDSVEPMLKAKANLYFSVLQSGAGLMAASNEVTREEWRAFLSNNQLIKNELKGVAGIGVIFRIDKNDINSFSKTYKLKTKDELNYHTLAGLSPEEVYHNIQRADSYIVTYIEPRATNLGKIGLDMASEEQRRFYADVARDTGEPTLSGRLILADDPDRLPAIILFYPFYKLLGDELPTTVSSRRERLIGWVYAPVKVQEFFSGVFQANSFKEISYSVTDEFNGVEQEIISTSDYKKLPISSEITKNIRFGNHDFTFRFKGSSAFFSNQDTLSSWIGAIAGIISLIMGTLIVSMQSVRKRAMSVASKSTEELKASEELWKFALEGAGESVWDWDINSGKAVVGNRFKNLLGYSEYEITDNYHDWINLIHPEDLPKVKEQLKLHFSGQLNFVCECRLLCKNGDYKWTLVRGMIANADILGKPRRMVGTMSDISLRKGFELEIERQRSKLHSIFEGASDALILLDEKGFLDCNSRSLKLFGFHSKDEFLSMQPADLSPKFQPDGFESSARSKQHIKKAFDEGMDHYEWIHCRKSGKTFPAEVLLTAFNYDGKKIIQVCVRDITERKIAESIVISQREKLVASAKMSSLGEMAGGIAHEINNPLTIIIGKTSLLKRRLEGDPNNVNSPKFKNSVSDELTNIQITAKRIGSIIRGLRSFSRNAENDPMEKIQVANLIDEMLEFSRERFKFHAIDLRVELVPDETIYINGRAAQLLQVLVNLLNNAYDAVETLDEKWVEIKVVKVGEVCKISVTDSGQGISPEVLEKIMMPFFTTKEIGRGTGLGLSISRGIVEDHKGKLYYDFTDGHTSFVVELPLYISNDL